MDGSRRSTVVGNLANHTRYHVWVESDMSKVGRLGRTTKQSKINGGGRTL